MKFPLKKWIMDHKILTGILAALLLIPSGLVLLLGCLLLTTQTAFPRPEITPDDWMRQSKVVMKAMQQTLRAEPGSVQELKLKPADVAALLKFAVNNDQIASLFSGNSTPEGVLWTITYDKKGHLHASYLAPTGVGALACILQITARIRYENNTFLVTPLVCKAGSLTIPNQMVAQHVIPRVLAELENNPYIQMFHTAVESITTDRKDRLVIRYIPDNAKEFGKSLFLQ